MNISTTLYMHKSNFNRLEKASKTLGISKNFIIRILLKKMMEDVEVCSKVWTTVKYQEDDTKRNWRQFHLVLHEGEYEYAIDMRKYYKMSLSLIVAVAIGRYLPQLIRRFCNKLIKNTQNLTYTNYLISKRIISGIVCWIVWWGVVSNPNILKQAYF